MDLSIKKEASATLDTLRRMLEETRQIKGWYWLTASTSLVLITPWLLYFSEIVFSGEGALLGKSSSLLSFVLLSAATLFVFCSTSLLDGIRKAKVTALALASFAVGITALTASNYAAPIAEQGAAIVSGVQFFGGAVCSIGYTTLLVRWVSIPYSRMSRDQAIMVICLGGCGAAIAYLLLSLLSFPFGCPAVIALFLIVFASAHACKCDDQPVSTESVGSITRAGEFVMQDGNRPKAVMAVCSFSFGFELASLLANDAFNQGLLQQAWQSMLLSLLVVAATMLLSFGRGRSILLNLLIASIMLSVIGSLFTCFEDFRFIGSLVLMSGFFVLTTFYLVFFSAVSQRKDASKQRILGIFRRTASIIPLATVCAVGLHWALSAVIPQYAYLMGAFECLAMTTVVVLMLTSELSTTRQALAQKSESTIALSSIKNFAAERGASYGLTERECEVLHMLMSGRSAGATAKELYLSENTVKTHTRSIYRKLEVHNRQEMIDLVTEKLHP